MIQKMITMISCTKVESSLWQTYGNMFNDPSNHSGSQVVIQNRGEAWVPVKTVTFNYIGDSTVLILPLMPTLSCT